VYDEYYLPIIEVTVDVHIEANTSWRVDFLLNDTEVLSMEGNQHDDNPVSQVFYNVTPGLYTINVSYSTNHEYWFSLSLTVTQRLAPGHLEELASWDAYKMLLMVASFFVVLLGIYPISPLNRKNKQTSTRNISRVNMMTCLFKSLLNVE
jgi:hypothetical protein